jgi:hypothetical protein
MAYTVVPTVIDGDDLTDDFTLKVKAAIDELQGTQWTAYTPAFTSVGWAVGTGGSAAAIGAYSVTNGTVHFYLNITFGTTAPAAAATSCAITLPPVTALSGAYSSQLFCFFLDSSTSIVYQGWGALASTTSVAPCVGNTAGTYEVPANMTNTVPVSMAASDTIVVVGWYRKA